jgi:hypothetical protein
MTGLVAASLLSRLALLSLLLPCAAAAQPQRPATPTDVTKREVVDSVASMLEQMYADPDTGRLIATRIRERLAGGAYRQANDWQHFARALTADLQSVNQDTHLWVEVGPPLPPPGAAPNPAQHGVERVTRLDGNVGYLQLSGFGGGESALRAVEAALWQLGTTDATIIDLRNARGGSGGLSNFIISHFMPADTAHVLTVYFRPQNVTTERYTLASVPGPRRPDVPLYILTDDVTRSAAEDVAFTLQNFKRALIVGGRTAGAGRNNTFVPLPYGLTSSVSISRVMEPGTRREWERIGVQPNVRVDPDSALNVAHRLALDTLIARAASPEQRRQRELVREVVVAAQHPVRVPVATLQRYVGTYEGGQFITVRDGRLVYQPRVAQPRVTLIALSATRFGDGATRYELDAEGTQPPKLRITLPDGSSTTYARTSASIAPRPGAASP